LAAVERDKYAGVARPARHYYASVLIDAGVSIKVVSEKLGHSDPAFTWRNYVHLIKGSEDRTRQAIDRLADLDEDGPRPGDGLDDA
jgi:integrase